MPVSEEEYVHVTASIAGELIHAPLKNHLLRSRYIRGGARQ